MKYSRQLLTLIVFCLPVATKCHAQTISFSGKHVPLQTVLTSIEKQTGLSFFFNYTLIQEIGPVSLTIRSVPLDKVLDILFKGLNISYYRGGKTIFITRQVAAGTSTSSNRTPASRGPTSKATSMRQ